MLMAVGAATAGLLGLTATTASASSTYYFGGNVVSQHCEAWVVSNGNSWNWAIGTVEGDANCQVRLWERNINTGGQTFTSWSTNQTSPLYHNDGVHQVRVEMWDGTSGSYGTGIWVN
ncbi:hypothetical protein ACWDBD_31735 [Streptomyces sp. NPDC001118]|uniref:hypothetical protein n=1 Tax=unclassified Streptomyces TaxID=2593676 RepID=UPI00332D71FC